MRRKTRPVIHDGPARLLHWVIAASVLLLMASGWEIFNAAPFYPVRFPAWATLGSDLTSALLWHLAAMWTLVAALVVLSVRLAARRHLEPALWPISPARALRELGAASRLRLTHTHGRYGHVQRAAYLGALTLLGLGALSGAVLWKPVQLRWLTDLMGGYEAARRVHFWAMAGVAGFTLMHVAMAALVPRTLVAMIVGLRAVGRDGAGRP